MDELFIHAGIQFYPCSGALMISKEALRYCYWFRRSIYFKGGWEKQCNQLSFFHLNVKSIPKHFDELDMYINSLKLEFTMIALTETWLDKGKQDLYNMPKYNCINRFRKQRRWGGVSLYIRNDIKYMSRPDLEYFDGEMESLFIEIDKNVFNLASNVVVGVIYRMPNTWMEVFNDRMSDIMNIVQRERKICYFLGDFNVDLLKYESHQSTAAFLDTLYSYNVFPLITKPTRVTRESATLIDHQFKTCTRNFMHKHIWPLCCLSYRRECRNYISWWYACT